MSVTTHLQRRLVAQFHRPHGPLGPLAGWIMTRRPSNRLRNEWTVDLLELRPTDRVLELGFGPGLAIAQASARVPDGTVVGIDHSRTMLRMAARRNARAIRAGRVRLRLAPFDRLPDFEAPFDAIFSVNALQFANEPDAIVRELAARLRHGGRLAITVQSRRSGASDADSRRAGAANAERLAAAGFSDIRVESLPLEPACAVCVLGTR